MNTKSSRQRGITMVEQLVAISAIAAVVTATAPKASDLGLKQRLAGNAAQLRTDMQWAKSEAIIRNQALRISFQRDGAKSCYVVHTGRAGACDCVSGESPRCTAGAEALKSQHWSDNTIAVASNSASILVDPDLGTVTPTASVNLVNAKGDTIRSIVNVMGRVRQCTPTRGMEGLPTC